MTAFPSAWCHRYRFPARQTSWVVPCCALSWYPPVGKWQDGGTSTKCLDPELFGICFWELYGIMNYIYITYITIWYYMLYELYVVNSWTKLFKYFQHVFHFLWSSYDCCAEATSLLNKICPDNLSTIVDHLASIKLVKAEELEYVIRIIFKKAISGKLEDIGRSWHILTGSPLIDIL